MGFIVSVKKFIKKFKKTYLFNFDKETVGEEEEGAVKVMS
jgi:hypothetical protein